MKKLLFILSSLILYVSLLGQQYAVYARIDGTLKPLPNGAAVVTSSIPGGLPGQIQFNNAGSLGGFTSSGDIVFNTATGLSTIQQGAVTNTKLVPMAAFTFKANNTSFSASPIDITATQAKSMLAITSSDVSGLGTISSQNSNAVTISGGAISGASVTGLPAPSSGTDAATKTYVDNNSSGITQRTSVAVATTANLTLSGEQTIDGVLTSASRILVKNQTLTQNNGIYVTAAGAWARATDSNSAAQLKVGYYYFVSAGTTQGSTGWTIQTAPTVLGTDPVIFGQFSASSSYSNGTGLALVGNVFSVNSALTLVGGSANNMPIGASTKNTGDFTTLTSTGGAFNGTVGATTKNTGSFTTLAATGSVTLGTGGTGTNSEQLILDGGNGTGGGGLMYFRKNGTVQGQLGNDSASFNSNSNDVGVVLGSGNNFNIYPNASPTPAAKFTSTGINAAAIGQTTPAAGTFTTISTSSNANLRTTKGNLHLTISVKDYGALGDGTTDDTAAINSAISAMANFTNLYFPPGRYKITSGLTAFDSLSYIAVYGDNAELYVDSGASGSNCLVFNNTCYAVEVYNLRFNGTASVRSFGCHIRMGAGSSSIHNNWFSGCAEFSVLLSHDVPSTSPGWINNVTVTDNFFGMSLGDGLHIGSATDVIVCGNFFVNTGDDSIGVVADVAGYQPTRVTIVGNYINGAGAGGSGCGIRVAESVDTQITGNQILNTLEAGIRCTRFTSTTAYNYRVLISENKIYNSPTLSGPLGAIECAFTNQSSVSGNLVVGSTAFGVAFLDCNDLVIKNNVVNAVNSRGIASDDTTTSNVANTWSKISILNNIVDTNSANQAYYFVPAAGKTIASLVVTGNTATNSPAGDYIYTNRLSGFAKIGNNVTLEARSITNGGSGTIPVTFNNN